MLFGFEDLHPVFFQEGLSEQLLWLYRADSACREGGNQFSFCHVISLVLLSNGFHQALECYLSDFILFSSLTKGNRDFTF